jgi:hypothetical protein
MWRIRLHLQVEFAICFFALFFDFSVFFFLCKGILCLNPMDFLLTLNYCNMQKRFKTVSMMLFLLGAITGTAYAAPSSVNADDVRITQQSGTCTGVVKDASGETVIGASVVVKGTTNGTITDYDGAFSLSNVKKGDVIQISFVGYKSQEVVWNGNPLSIVLKDDTQALEEVVVVGFDSQKKTNLTGSLLQGDYVGS